jgi:cytochrome c-type biogenesis protein CcmE
MKKHGRFMVGLVGVAAVVSYLIWTGVSNTMVYYLTPTELFARVKADPSFRNVGVKVSGKVVAGSVERVPDQLVYRFRVHDLSNASVVFPVEYHGTLPDTFTDQSEVVLEGRLDGNGVFQATSLLTKCGSRYEASQQDLKKDVKS